MKKSKRREERMRLAAELAAEPVPESTPPPKPPWAAYGPQPGEEREQTYFYGPAPDSPDGISSAEEINARINRELMDVVNDAVPREDRYARPLTAPPEDYPQANLRRRAQDEPPRLYVIQRSMKTSGLTELRTQNGEWTRDVAEADVRQAHQLSPVMPEDEKPWVYDLVPVDAIIYRAQQAKLDEEYSTYLIDWSLAGSRTRPYIDRDRPEVSTA